MSSLFFELSHFFNTVLLLAAIKIIITKFLVLHQLSYLFSPFESWF